MTPSGKHTVGFLERVLPFTRLVWPSAPDPGVTGEITPAAPLGSESCFTVRVFDLRIEVIAIARCVAVPGWFDPCCACGKATSCPARPGRIGDARRPFISIRAGSPTPADGTRRIWHGDHRTCLLADGHHYWFRHRPESDPSTAVAGLIRVRVSAGCRISPTLRKPGID
jgi:hypothetical protein